MSSNTRYDELIKKSCYLRQQVLNQLTEFHIYYPTYLNEETVYLDTIIF